MDTLDWRAEDDSSTVEAPACRWQLLHDVPLPPPLTLLTTPHKCSECTRSRPRLGRPALAARERLVFLVDNNLTAPTLLALAGLTLPTANALPGDEEKGEVEMELPTSLPAAVSTINTGAASVAGVVACAVTGVVAGEVPPIWWSTMRWGRLRCKTGGRVILVRWFLSRDLVIVKACACAYACWEW